MSIYFLFTTTKDQTTGQIKEPQPSRLKPLPQPFTPLDVIFLTKTIINDKKIHALHFILELQPSSTDTHTLKRKTFAVVSRSDPHPSPLSLRALNDTSRPSNTRGRRELVEGRLHRDRRTPDREGKDKLGGEERRDDRRW